MWLARRVAEDYYRQEDWPGARRLVRVRIPRRVVVVLVAENTNNCSVKLRYWRGDTGNDLLCVMTAY